MRIPSTLFNSACHAWSAGFRRWYNATSADVAAVPLRVQGTGDAVQHGALDLHRTGSRSLG
jgi:hypothetical protein